MGLQVRLDLGFFLKRGLAPHANPGPLWSLQECQGMPQGQSHFAAEEERMQQGHFNCVHAIPLTKVLLAASLSFWHVARGHCNKKREWGTGVPFLRSMQFHFAVCAQFYRPGPQQV